MKFTLLTTLALTTLTSALPPDYEYRPFATPDLPPAKPHVDLNILWEMCRMLTDRGPASLPHLDLSPGMCVRLVKPLFGFP
ncbi:hypothetical protein HBI56_195630 [Parastagonospora nodorum]|uniref:Uncharacterized protein n=2 Tax=Phaeosphaeria nodorum (strain SN15 / ATCC MYA-4574 / FGSC 10173) TaxID=321614 RepID=A0A7U2F6C0_PHANO|nr:hypothetical protein SNOG_15113 [Parastagonospora nodorum SN15]KAH3906030.1 hypothetical protein HBH56_207560 [Parastagonospora nodorum]EAT77656.1 hypothetical protein SNOG_15113 [Parastagonospora nodorum SN15]KAH3923657.1 hypothetical protein HBH54_206430 [Parastagonospora nodorum]KAH3941557.1 hypothetical protein HBH53_200400 [Parastagonospora nodorum]KAH3960386.1 hypothetical protein HBH51_190960 [Parastagonospora nodorum]